MKTPPLLLASAICLALGAPRARADQLDDIIAGLRSGAAAPANKKEIMKTTGAAASKVYNATITDLYLMEVKFSIIDGENNGGWPFRSFLVEDDSILREGVTKTLKERYKEKPDSILAYALICPALYADDAALVASLENYLKDDDPYLYKLEQTQIEKYWRPYIAAVEKLILAPQVMCKILPYIASKGTDRELVATVANPLGLAASGAAWSYRGIGIQGPDPKSISGFGVSRGSDPDILLSQRTADSVHVYRASREGAVIKAVIFNLSTNQVTTIDPVEAQTEFNTDWNFWSNEIDDLVAGTGIK